MTDNSLSRRQAQQCAIVLLLSLLGGGLALAQAPVAGSASMTASLPLSPVEQAEKDGTALRISLKDLTKLALQNNLDIAISDTNEEIYRKRVLQAYGPYDPEITASMGVQSNRRPNTNATNQSSEGDVNETTGAFWNFEFAQNLSTGGGIRASYSSNRSNTNQAFALFSPQYGTGLTVEFTHPLYRNRRIDQTRGTIRLANLDARLNDSQFRQTVSSTIAAIQALYWDLVGAIHGFEIRRDNVKLAQISFQNNSKSVEIGALPRISITEARAEMANREVDMIASRASILVAENNLRAVISPDRNAEIWQKVIVPTDIPEFVEYPVDRAQAIETALRNRPELEQFNLQLEQNSISRQMDLNQKKWQVDLVASLGTVGVAGPQSIDPDTGLPLINPDLIGGIGKANLTLFTGGFINWFAGFDIRIPLRNRGLDAQLAQLQIQRQQLSMSRTNVEQKIAVQVRNAIEDLETNKQRVQTARVALQLAQEQLEGEELRFQAGMSQNWLVLQRQQFFANAKGVELQALIAYKRSIINVQNAMWTLLESNDFEVIKSVPREPGKFQFR
jgi:outer membrane protein TolC